MDLKKPAILSISLLTVMTNAAVAPMLRLISASFPAASPTFIKQVVTIPSLMIIIFSIISGQLERFLSKKTILAIGLCGYLVGAFFSAMSTSIMGLVIFRAVMGSAAGLIVPLASSLISDFYTGKECAKMVGYSSFTSYFGAAFAPILASWIGNGKWQNTFYIYITALFVLLFTMVCIPNKQKQRGHSETGSRTKLNFMIFLLAFTGCLLYVIFYLIPTDISFLIAKIPATNPSHAAMLLAIEIIAAASAGVIFSHLTRNLDKRAFPLGFGLMALGFYIVYITTSFPILILGMIIIGLGIGTLRPLIIFQTAQASPPETTTTAFALVNSGFSLGQFVSPFFYLSITRVLSINPVSGNYLIAAVFLLAAAIITIITTRSR